MSRRKSIELCTSCWWHAVSVAHCAGETVGWLDVHPQEQEPGQEQEDEEEKQENEEIEWVVHHFVFFFFFFFSSPFFFFFFLALPLLLFFFFFFFFVFSLVMFVPLFGEEFVCAVSPSIIS